MIRTPHHIESLVVQLLEHRENEISWNREKEIEDEACLENNVHDFRSRFLGFFVFCIHRFGYLFVCVCIFSILYTVRRRKS